MTDIKDLLKERGGTHGHWALQSRISENLWQIMLSTDKAYSPSQAQALHMICTKLGRIAAGNEDEIDHWKDIAGYATLVANDLEPKLAEGFSMERANTAAEAQTKAAHGRAYSADYRTGRDHD